MKFFKYFTFILLLKAQCFATDLTIVTEEYPPYNFTLKKGFVTGLSSEIVLEMLKRSHLTAKLEMYPWGRALQMTELSPNTCIISAIRTAERENKFKWIGPITSDVLALFAISDSKIIINNLADAKKYTVGTYLKSGAIPILLKNGLKFEEASRDNLNPRKLVNKHIDLWIGNSKTGPYTAFLEGVNVKPVFLFSEPVTMYMACNKAMTNETVINLNKNLKSMITDGTLEKIEKKYFHRD